MFDRLINFLLRCHHRDLMGWVYWSPGIGHWRRCFCGEQVPVEVEIAHRVRTKEKG